MIFNDKQFKNDLHEINNELEVIKGDIAKKPDKLDKDAYERIADLEVKMAKLWGLLLETSERTGKPKLTRFGRKFGGMASQL